MVRETNRSATAVRQIGKVLVSGAAHAAESENLQRRCRFSFLVSYSHPQCHVSVIYDRAVRLDAPRSGVSITSMRRAG